MGSHGPLKLGQISGTFQMSQKFGDNRKSFCPVEMLKLGSVCKDHHPMLYPIFALKFSSGIEFGKFDPLLPKNGSSDFEDRPFTIPEMYSKI